MIVDDYKKNLRQLVFLNYENFDNINGFFWKNLTVTYKTATYNATRVKRNTKKWFDDEVLEKLNSRYQLFNKRSRLFSHS